jgi:hypothetical protein
MVYRKKYRAMTAARKAVAMSLMLGGLAGVLSGVPAHALWAHQQNDEHAGHHPEKASDEATKEGKKADTQEKTPTAMSAPIEMHCRMFMQMNVGPTNPAALVAVKDQLGLSQDQVQRLQVSLETASKVRCRPVLESSGCYWARTSAPDLVTQTENAAKTPEKPGDFQHSNPEKGFRNPPRGNVVFLGKTRYSQIRANRKPVGYRFAFRGFSPGNRALWPAPFHARRLAGRYATTGRATLPPAARPRPAADQKPARGRGRSSA